MNAAERGHIDCVRVLLDAGVKKTAVNLVRHISPVHARARICCRASCFGWYLRMLHFVVASFSLSTLSSAVLRFF